MYFTTNPSFDQLTLVSHLHQSQLANLNLPFKALPPSLAIHLQMKSAHQKIFKKPEFDFRKELKKLPVRVLLELFVVSPEDIDKLYHHFLLLNPTLHGLIPIDAFTRLPGAKENPLARRIAECLDVNDDGEVEFAEFVDGLAVFSSRCSRLEKIRCKPYYYFSLYFYDFLVAFNIYDIDKDGYISNGELFLSLKIMSGDHLDDIQLQVI